MHHRLHPSHKTSALPAQRPAALPAAAAVPPARGRQVWLQFGAVDENYTLWINGQYIGDNVGAGTSMWDQPVKVDITGKFHEGRPNHLVVRVNNTALGGGIWKPVRVLVEK